ncbi:MAG TPA: hypothetical protein VK968_01230, partial [Roseimicrobium sp.]|nr:hypothetical protein [Roseimicrobium sp.]
AVDEWGFVSEIRDTTSASHSQRQADLFRRFGAWKKAFSDFESGSGQVSSRVLQTTVLFAAEHKLYRATEEDEKSTRLALVNLAWAWEALPTVQSEFRKRFGHLYPATMLEELDKHERSNFRHLWPAAFAMHYEREVRIPNFGTVRERETAQLRTDFLKSLMREIEDVLGPGSVSISDSPWVVDGKPNLRIVCNHHSVASLNDNKAGVVLAIWRACRFKQWRNMEWQPLAIEWPQLATVHLLNGKALIPACVQLSTMVLCSTDEGFVPQQHHLLELPVDSEQFGASGIQMINNPLVERLIGFQGALVAFCLTVPRFFEMLELSRTHDLQVSDIEQMIRPYARELTLVWHEAQTQLEFLRNALTACGFPQVLTWSDGLRSICEKLLFAATPDKSLTLTDDDFEAWNGAFESEFQQMTTLVGDMLSTLLFQEPPQLRPA